MNTRIWHNSFNICQNTSFWCTLYSERHCFIQTLLTLVLLYVIWHSVPETRYDLL